MEAVNITRGLPPDEQASGAPVAGFAHSWKTTSSVPFGRAAAEGNAFERGEILDSDARSAAVLVASTLMLP